MPIPQTVRHPLDVPRWLDRGRGGILCGVPGVRPGDDRSAGGKLGRGRVVRVVTADGGPVCEECVVADTARLRMRGLLGRHALPAGEGIWIRPTNSIHMFFMRFAIDAVFVDADQIVTKIVPGLKPWRMSFSRRARSVLELAEGEADRRRLRVGARLDVEERDDLRAAA